MEMTWYQINKLIDKNGPEMIKRLIPLFMSVDVLKQLVTEEVLLDHQELKLRYIADPATRCTTFLDMLKGGSVQMYGNLVRVAEQNKQTDLVKLLEAEPKAQAPAPMVEQPASMTQQPTSMTQQPESVAHQPASMTQQPTFVAQQPASVTQQPTSAAQHPASVTQQPTSAARQPASMTQQPTPVAQQPASMTQKPTSVAQQPASMTQQPTSVAQQPASVTQKPAPVAQQPAVMTQQPAPVPQLPPPMGHSTEVEMKIALWDGRHPDGKTLLLKKPDLKRKLENALPELKVLVRPENLWANLQKYRVMNDLDLEECQAAGVAGPQTEAIVRYLKKDQVWKLHAFFRALAHIEQDYLIDLVLGKGASESYNKNLLDN